MKQKKLIKLNLETEQLVSLNDREMFNLKGGDDGTSSNDCLYESIKISINFTKDIYEYGEDNSYWNCPSPPASAVIQYGACRLPTVIITP